MISCKKYNYIVDYNLAIIKQFSIDDSNYIFYSDSIILNEETLLFGIVRNKTTNSYSYSYITFPMNFCKNLEKNINFKQEVIFEEFLIGNITIQSFPNNGKIFSNNGYSWSELNITNNNKFNSKNIKYVSINENNDIIEFSINNTKPINASFEDCKITFIKTCSIENCDCIYISGEEFCEKCQDGYDLVKNDDLIKCVKICNEGEKFYDIIDKENNKIERICIGNIDCKDTQYKFTSPSNKNQCLDALIL